MILSKLTKFAWAFFVLVLTAGTLSAQKGNSRNLTLNGGNNACLNQISGLSTEQTEKIRELNNEHQQEMAQLRNERRSETNSEVKDQIRSEMLANIDNHRSEVRSLLNKNQQNAFDAIQQPGNSNANLRNRFLQRNKGNSASQQRFGKYGNGSGSCRY